MSAMFVVSGLRQYGCSNLALFLCGLFDVWSISFGLSLVSLSESLVDCVVVPCLAYILGLIFVYPWLVLLCCSATASMLLLSFVVQGAASSSLGDASFCYLPLLHVFLSYGPYFRWMGFGDVWCWALPCASSFMGWFSLYGYPVPALQHFGFWVWLGVGLAFLEMSLAWYGAA
ncbi:hypothetical protein U1Q18_022358 [Sarracenia purpurea var. burkii]